MTIKITTDSTCDLTKELLETYDIEVLPLYIIKGGVPFRDLVDITPEDIYRHVAGGGDITTTAALNAEDYIACFSRFSPDYDAVIHINLGAEISSCHQNAVIAAQQFPNVYVVDSRNLSSGHGHVVLEAVRLAQQGMEAEEVALRLQAFTGQLDVSFLLDQLEYLRKGGRCSALAAVGANLLKLKPCIEVEDGKMRVGKKYRGAFRKALSEYTRDRLQGRKDVDAERVIVVSTACPPELVDMVRRDVENYTGLPPMTLTTAGCTIATHCGPCTLGIMFVRK
jgi:DegV family protein with EDD domain